MAFCWAQKFHRACPYSCSHANPVLQYEILCNDLRLLLGWSQRFDVLEAIRPIHSACDLYSFLFPWHAHSWGPRVVGKKWMACFKNYWEGTWDLRRLSSDVIIQTRVQVDQELAWEVAILLLNLELAWHLRPIHYSSNSRADSRRDLMGFLWINEDFGGNRELLPPCEVLWLAQTVWRYCLLHYPDRNNSHRYPPVLSALHCRALNVRYPSYHAYNEQDWRRLVAHKRYIWILASRRNLQPVPPFSWRVWRNPWHCWARKSGEACNLLLFCHHVLHHAYDVEHADRHHGRQLRSGHRGQGNVWHQD